MWPFSSSRTDDAATAGAADKCPVDHETRQAWLLANPGKAHPFQPESSAAQSSVAASTSKAPPVSCSSSSEPRLSTERVVSSIPRHYIDGSASTSAQAGSDEERETHWVYPSPQQFYNAMKRKDQNPQTQDMDIVVPIHNAVNEEAWRQILDWERQWTGERGAEAKLISFKGRPKDLTWRAWFRGLAGYQHPFDRHDWTIARDGHQMRYIIDFYTGRSTPMPASQQQQQPMANNLGAGQTSGAKSLSFFIDVRPAPDTVEGIAMRASRMWHRWTSSPSPAA